jgi:Complex I intermediate-associated protein 30 (CIA30)
VSEQNQSQLGRLFQTLIYFDIIPFWGCLKQIFFNSQVKLTRKNLLLVGFQNNSNIDLIKLIKNTDYNLRVIVSDIAEARQYWGDQVQLIEANNLTSDLMDNVETVIYNPHSNLDIEKISNFIANNMTQHTDKMLFDFSQINLEIKEIWGALDDVVMGGISNSNIRISNNVAIFSGNVSVQNNGGFASVRTRNFTPAWDLSAYSGIEIRLKGDGKRYKFIARCEGKWDGLAYAYSFDTIYNFSQTIRIPFQDLIPTFRAKTVSNAEKFDSSKVYSLQFMLSKFEYDGQLNPKFDPGFFSLEIEYIKAY